MNETKTGHSRWYRVVLLVAVLCLVLAMLCFGYPGMRRAGMLTTIGERTLVELGTFTTAVSHYSAAEIDALAASPKMDASYKDLAALLTQVRIKNDYVGLSLLVRGKNKQVQYLVDSAYRDNAKAGGDYYAPATAYPTERYKASKELIDAIYSGKSVGGYSTQLATLGNLKQVSNTYLPVYGPGNTVIAVLAVDCDPGNTGYHMLGPIDLNQLGIAALIVLAVCLLVLWLLRLWDKHRAKKNANEPIDAAFEEPASEGTLVPIEEIAAAENQSDPAGYAGPAEPTDDPTDPR
ncbi:MAG: hypothetical protein RRY21_04335 [Oscillospiraceae bacterium]